MKSEPLSTYMSNDGLTKAEVWPHRPDNGRRAYLTHRVVIRKRCSTSDYDPWWIALTEPVAGLETAVAMAQRNCGVLS